MLGILPLEKRELGAKLSLPCSRISQQNYFYFQTIRFSLKTLIFQQEVALWEKLFLKQIISFGTSLWSKEKDSPCSVFVCDVSLQLQKKKLGL